MAMHQRADAQPEMGARWQPLVWLSIIAGLVALYLPSLVDLFRTIWSTAVGIWRAQPLTTSRLLLWRADAQ